MLRLVHISDLHLVPRALPSVHKAVLDVQKLLDQNPILKRLPATARIWHFYSWAYQNAQRELLNAFADIRTAEDTLLIITGDVCSLPYEEPSEINAEYYKYVSDLGAALGAKRLVVLLGNHDWDLLSNTPFQRTYFQANHNAATLPRVECFRGSKATLVFFVLDSTRAIFPATGEVPKNTLDTFLPGAFKAGKDGKLTLPDGTALSSIEYGAAVKVVLIHHTPAPHSAYRGRMSWLSYWVLRLKNRQELLQRCAADVDLMLFGHSHHPCVVTLRNFVTVDAGSALATDSGSSPPTPSFS